MWLTNLIMTLVALLGAFLVGFVAGNMSYANVMRKRAPDLLFELHERMHKEE